MDVVQELLDRGRPGMSCFSFGRGTGAEPRLKIGGKSSDSAPHRGGERKGPLGAGKSQPTPPPGRAPTSTKRPATAHGSELSPLGQLGRPLGTGAAQVGRRCRRPPTAATPCWSSCSSLRVLGAQTFSTHPVSHSLGQDHCGGLFTFVPLFHCFHSVWTQLPQMSHGFPQCLRCV